VVTREIHLYYYVIDITYEVEESLCLIHVIMKCVVMKDKMKVYCSVVTAGWNADGE